MFGFYSVQCFCDGNLYTLTLGLEGRIHLLYSRPFCFEPEDLFINEQTLRGNKMSILKAQKQIKSRWKSTLWAAISLFL